MGKDGGKEIDFQRQRMREIVIETHRRQKRNTVRCLSVVNMQNEQPPTVLI